MIDPLDGARWRIDEADALTAPADLPHGVAQCMVTSPPYWGGVRDYQIEPTTWPDGWVGQLGHEPTPDLYAAHLVDVLGSWRPVLRTDATVWLNLGDIYFSEGGGAPAFDPMSKARDRRGDYPNRRPGGLPGLKPKDLVGIPWLVAFALRAAGWWLRSEIVWSKPNAQPSPVRDRPTVAHETLFLLSPSKRYFYDVDAIREPHTDARTPSRSRHGKSAMRGQAEIRPRGNFGPESAESRWYNPAGRNARSVWTIATQRFGGAHFATMAPRLALRCILAGTSSAGCCATCFAPLARVVERPDFKQAPKRRATEARGGKRSLRVAPPMTSSGSTWQAWRDANPDITVGFQPSCKCGGGGHFPASSSIPSTAPARRAWSRWPLAVAISASSGTQSSSACRRRAFATLSSTRARRFASRGSALSPADNSGYCTRRS